MNTFIPPRWGHQLLGVLRIIVGVLFTLHGTQKLFGWPAFPGQRPPFDITTLFSMAGVLETVGGVLILLGIATRLVAFILSGEMAVAYFVGHSAQGLNPLENGGELAMLFCFIFLFFSAVGSGAFALSRQTTGLAASSRNT